METEQPQGQPTTCAHRRLGPDEIFNGVRFAACLDCGAIWSVDKWKTWDAEHYEQAAATEPEPHVHERGHQQESHTGTGGFKSTYKLTYWQCRGCALREPEAWWDGYEKGVRDGRQQAN